MNEMELDWVMISYQTKRPRRTERVRRDTDYDHGDEGHCRIQDQWHGGFAIDVHDGGRDQNQNGAWRSR